MRHTNESLRWYHPEPSSPSSPSLVKNYERTDISSCSSSCSTYRSTDSCNLSVCDLCACRVPNTAQEVRFIFESPAEDTITVSQGSSRLYTMRRMPRRWHCWQVFDAQGNKIARFRASQAFSWLVLIDESGKELTIGQPWWNANRLEWSLGKRLLLRWSQNSLGMLLIRDSRVQLPQAASFSMMPSTLPAPANGLYTCLSWRPPANAIEFAALKPVVVATAFIAMWKWSREPQFYVDFRDFFAKHCIQWLVNSVSLDSV